MTIPDITFDDIQAAARHLSGQAHRTPVITSHRLNARLGDVEVFIKAENFQRVGAFKFRGAYNAVSQLSDDERSRGVITVSSGNHAQAIALAGSLLGAKTTVVMPDNAAATKRAATAGYGGNIILAVPDENERMAQARQLADQYGYTIIPPCDHPHVVAGQGTAALELFEDVGKLDALLVPCGGGGLLSGSAITARAISPGCQVIGVEPELADDATRSFRSKTRIPIVNPPTIADGVRTSLGEITFPLVLRYVDDFVTVSEDAIKEAVRFAILTLKMVIEPSGALGIAALLSGAFKPKGRVGVIVSGGNVDPTLLASILAEGEN
jgi:threo-3-hydroxy-L-aspartate ammonia-lyase